MDTIAKKLIALIPILTFLGAWAAWEASFAPLMIESIGLGKDLVVILGELEVSISYGQITEQEAISSLRKALIEIQEAHADLFFAIKAGMVFLFLAIGLGSSVGTIRMLFLEIRGEMK